MGGEQLLDLDHESRVLESGVLQPNLLEISLQASGSFPTYYTAVFR